MDCEKCETEMEREDIIILGRNIKGWSCPNCGHEADEEGVSLTDYEDD